MDSIGLLLNNVLSNRRGILPGPPMNRVSTVAPEFRIFGKLLFDSRITSGPPLQGMPLAALIGAVNGYPPVRWAANLRRQA